MRLPSTSVIEKGPVRARLTSMFDRSVSFDLLLTSIRPDGLVGTLDSEAVEHAAGGPFWAEIKLPNEDRIRECVVRLKHCRRAGTGSQVAVGWAFCGGDEPPAVGGGMTFSRRAIRGTAGRATCVAPVVEGQPC